MTISRKTIAPAPYTKKDTQSAFALVVALGLLSFVVVLLLSITMLARVELNSAQNGAQRLLARENARLGVMVALGNLQRYAGPDQRVTARAEVVSGAAAESGKWAGVWDANSGTATNPIWLVSGQSPDPASGASGTQSRLVLSDTSNAAAVRVERQPILGANDAESGDFAFWVEDESVKARVNVQTDTSEMTFVSDLEEAQNIAESIFAFPSQDRVFEQLIPDTAPADEVIPLTTVESLSKAINPEQLALVLPSGTDPQTSVRNERHNFSAYAASVLENPIQGGLKTNLTGRTQEELDNLLLLPGNENDSYLKGDYHLYHNIDPLTGIPLPNEADPNAPELDKSSITSSGELARVPAADFYGIRNTAVDPDDNDMQVVRNVMPVVSEMSFRLGAFHTRSDTKHRIRYHVDVEFWNPYPFPIRMAPENRDRCFVAMLVPTVIGEEPSDREKLILSVERTIGFGRVSVIDWEIHTNLFDFDERLNNSGDNTLNETVINSWMVIDDVVLQPGEVYHATLDQTQGLARILGGYVLRAGGDRDDPEDYEVDPAGQYIKHSWETVQNPTHPYIYADDQIRVSLRMPENGVTMRLIAFDNASTSSSNSPLFEDNASEWATPLFELRNIYKVENPPPLSLRGDEYSRTTSGSYTLNNYNVGFHYRLADELVVGLDPDAADLALRFDLRQPVWDYDNPAVQQLVDITEENPFAVSQLNNVFDGTDVLADGNADTHGGSYERATLYSRPSGEPLTVGSFHRLPLTYETVDFDLNNDGFDQPVQVMPGMPWGGEINEVFDKYFFTGVPATNWTDDQPLPVAAEPLSEVTAERMREADATSELLVRGGFNVNSLSGPAWAAMLGRTIHDWRYSTSNTIDLKNAFLNLAQSTDDAIEEYGSLTTDESLTDFDTSNSVGPGRLAMRYPLRRLTDLEIYNPDTEDDDSLVEFILTGLSDYFASNPPFPSVAAFVNSGILERAIRESGINGNVARYSPAYVSQATILEPLAPLLTVRSDTFVVRSIGTQTNPVTGEVENQVVCEAIVQRLPERVDGDASLINDPATSNGNTFGRKFIIRNITWKGEI